MGGWGMTPAKHQIHIVHQLYSIYSLSKNIYTHNCTSPQHKSTSQQSSLFNMADSKGRQLSIENQSSL